MAFMENVMLRGTTFYVVLNIPPAARPAFAGKAQVWKSLRTKDKTEARNRAVPLLAALEAQVKAASARVAPTALASAVQRRIIIPRDHGLAAIERWRWASIQQAYDEHWNDAAPPFSNLSDEGRRLSDIRYRLSIGDLDGIPSFYPAFSDALNSQGVGADPAHPILPKLAPVFAEAWANVERHIERFRLGDFDRWPEAVDEIVDSAGRAATPKAPANTLRVMEAFEQWVAIERPKEPERVRAYFRLLISFLNDKPMADIDHHDLDRFKLELRKYPNTKKDVSKLGFLEAIAKFERDKPGYPRLSDTTQYGYWRHYNIVWKFAHGRRMIPFNPVAAVMPKKPEPATTRVHYDADDIAAIFSAPLFHGASVMLNNKGRRWAYATTPGHVLVKDAYYWIPLFALFHGVRLEEIGGARVSELIKVEDRWAFDWTDRTNLKNATSSRVLPIHQKLIELGFIEYVQGQPKEGFIFPELPHHPDDEEAGTRQFSKWWGMWCTANAKVKGQGIDVPVVKVFHSFRHSFKRAARGRVEKQISDLLSGHKGTNDVSQKYGFGADFEVLVENIDKIAYPSFPRLPI